MNNKEVEQRYLETQKELNKLLFKNRLMKDNYKIVAIGYLDSNEKFEKGNVSKAFLNKLKILWSEGPTLASMGYHECPFCEGGYETGKKATSSSEKILIDTENKIKYIMPKMIFHYIEIHKFRPPLKFIEFVMKK